MRLKDEKKQIKIDDLISEYNTLYKKNHLNITRIKNQLRDIQRIGNDQNNHLNIYSDILKKLIK